MAAGRAQLRRTLSHECVHRGGGLRGQGAPETAGKMPALHIVALCCAEFHGAVSAEWTQFLWNLRGAHLGDWLLLQQ